MEQWVTNKMGSTNKDLAKKSKFPANSSLKTREKPIRNGSHNRDRNDGMAPPATPASKVKQEPRTQTAIDEQQYQGAFGTDIESIGDTTTDDGVAYNGPPPQISQKAVQQPQPVLNQSHDEETIQYDGHTWEAAQDLRQLYPDGFATDEEALAALESRRVFRFPDGHFAWMGDTGSYPTTTSGEWDDDEMEGRVESSNNRNEQVMVNSAVDDETQHLNIDPKSSATQTQVQRPPTGTDITTAQGTKGAWNANRGQQDVYQQIRQQAGVPQRITHRETRPVTPQPPARAAEQITPQPTPYRPTTHVKQRSLHTQGRYTPVHHPAPEYDQLELDFDPANLYTKNFGDLKRMAFDDDPRAAAPILGEVDQAKSLTDRLALVSGFPPDQQATFFSSLGLDDWEEAGDWFIDQFSQILRRLKDARREKRNLALAFEDEIEQRHEAVSRRRIIVDHALRGMKTSGAAVLRQTPNKNTKE